MTAFLLMVLSVHLSAKTLSQTVTFQGSNVPIRTVLDAVKRQTGYYLAFNSNSLNETNPVTINAIKLPLLTFLQQVAAQQPIQFLVQRKTIFIVRKPTPPGRETANVYTFLSPYPISGRITDEQGNPLAGATLAIRNSKSSTVTDTDGRFSLNVSAGDVIVISFIGYENKEVAITSGDLRNTKYSLNGSLSLKQTALDEVVVNKGYYTTSQRLNTGSVSTVDSKAIDEQPVSNPLAALQGRVPGLLVTQGNGLPGSNFKVLIRGQNSIQSGNSPFYIIDGVPFLNESDVLTQQSGINSNSPFNTINTSDIENIEVLKDADATAIYGSRGANGVILITTKKGKAGKTNLDVNVYSGWGRTTRTMSYLNTQQYLAMRHEAFRNDGVTEDISNAYDLLAWDTTRYTDIKKLLIGNTAHTDNVNMRFSGGNVNTNFSIGSNYYRESTVFPGSNADNRVATDLSLTHKIPNTTLSTTVSLSYANDKNNLINQDLSQFINLPPDIPALYDSAGKLNWSTGGFSFNNPLAETLMKYNVASERLTANIILQYVILKGLSVKLNLGYNAVNTNENSRIPISSQNPLYGPVGYSFFGNSSFKNWIAEPQIQYNTDIGRKGKFQLLAGGSRQSNSTEKNSINGYGYTNDNLLESTVGAQTLVASNAHELYRYESLFGGLNYNWDQKYVINITGRRDGSSRFGPKRQFANFGAIGAGWVFSSEPAVQRTMPFLSYGKLRGSYGITGNDLIGNYQFLDTYGATQYQYQGITSLFPTRLFNSDYSWEQIRKTDFALEAGLWKNRIFITAEWFKNKSDNQIIYYSLPGQTGFNNVLRNFPGVVQNTGFELSLTTQNVKGKTFSWETSFNFTSPKNKLMSFPGLAASGYAYRYILGKSLNTYIGAPFLGVDPQTGVYQFADKNKVPTFVPAQQDYAYVGTTDPKYYGGLQNSFRYRQWHLDFLFEFRKQQGVHPVYSSFSSAGTMANQPVDVLNRWQKPGDSAPYEQFTQSFGPAGISVFYLYNSSAVLTDASFCRLKNASLSYTLLNGWSKKIKMQKCRLYIETQNLFVITRYKGADPENQSFYSLPPLRKLVAGLQITF